MDQVKIDIVDTKVPQSDIETLLNTVVEGTPDLTRDLPGKQPAAGPPHESSTIQTTQMMDIHLRRSQTAVRRTDGYPPQRIPRSGTTF